MKLKRYTEDEQLEDEDGDHISKLELLIRSDAPTPLFIEKPS